METAKIFSLLLITYKNRFTAMKTDSTQPPAAKKLTKPPKKPSLANNLYVQHRRTEIKLLLETNWQSITSNEDRKYLVPGLTKPQISSMINDEWKSLTKEKKTHFQSLYTAMKKRYRADLAAYNKAHGTQLPDETKTTTEALRLQKVNGERKKKKKPIEKFDTAHWVKKLRQQTMPPTWADISQSDEVHVG